MSNKLYYRLGLEELVEPEVTHPVVVLQGSELEANQLHHELTQDSKEFEALFADSDTLEDTRVALENAIKGAVIDRNALAFVQKTVRSIDKRWGMDYPLPSMEGSNDVVVASMEGGILQRLADMIKAFIEMIKKTWAHFTGWISSLFDRSKSISAKAKAMIERVRSTSFPPVNPGVELTIGGKYPFLQNLAIGNNSPEALDAGVRDVGMLVGALGSFSKLGLNVVERAKNITDYASLDQAAYLNWIHVINDVVTRTPVFHGSEIVKRNWATTRGTLLYRANREFMGGVGIYYQTAPMSPSVAKAVLSSDAGATAGTAIVYSGMRLYIKPFSETPVKKSETFPLLANPEDIIKVCSITDILANHIGEYRRSYGDRYKAKTDAIKAIEHSLHTAENATDSRIRHAVREYTRFFTDMWSAGIAQDHTVLKYAQTIAESLLKYAALCLRMSTTGFA